MSQAYAADFKSLG
jgi:hypothetical protein